MAPPPSDLAQRVRAFLAQHGAAAQSVGVAVSGGLDSICLAHLLLEIGYRPAIVHVNHQLRGEESEGDEAFVRAFAEQHRLPFHSTRADVRTHAERYGLSTQVAARQLRYAFFEELLGSAGFAYLLTAHHADDQVETLLLSLLRGKEWNIMGGIPAVRGPYLRPLLTTTRAELEAYQKSNGIAYREDSSNTDEAYLRNKIRHTVLPVLREVNPNLTAHLTERLAHYQTQLALLQAGLPQTPAAESRTDGSWWVPLPPNAPQSFRACLVRDLPPPFTGHPHRVDRLCALVETQVGRQLHLGGWDATRERDGILLQPAHARAAFEPHDFFASGAAELPTGTLHIAFDAPADLPATEHIDLNSLVPILDDWIELFDDCNDGPPRLLRLRPWQDGDRYQPLGMSGTQNVSDILTDKKVPSHLRRTYWVLEDGKGIVLLQGHRPAERVKLTEATTRLLAISWHPYVT